MKENPQPTYISSIPLQIIPLYPLHQRLHYDLKNISYLIYLKTTIDVANVQCPITQPYITTTVNLLIPPLSILTAEIRQNMRIIYNISDI